MKIKPIYIVNFVFIILIIALLFTPFRNLLRGVQTTNAESRFPPIKTLSSEQYNIDLKGVNTEDVNFSSFKGKKIFLHFWGTWCPVCVEEMPDIQNLYNKKRNEYEFVFIYMKDNRKDVEEYLHRNKYTIPVYEAVSPIENSLLPGVFPTTILIDEKGNIKDRIEGSTNWINFEF